MDKIISDILHLSAANILSNYGHIFHAHYAAIWSSIKGLNKDILYKSSSYNLLLKVIYFKILDYYSDIIFSNKIIDCKEEFFCLILHFEIPNYNTLWTTKEHKSCIKDDLLKTVMYL